ncbi:hypothetical protein BKA70DRAFT_1438689 [Coprinopsis sp. MPI-PUGE-AT-0042]|nr:hypothetical protein BKA70DRAFT_1438689 [Coprinopsis sp. MPI-PUGE-AT-0042]
MLIDPLNCNPATQGRLSANPACVSMLATTSEIDKRFQLRPNPDWAVLPPKERIGRGAPDSHETAFELTDSHRRSWTADLQSVLVEGLSEFVKLLARQPVHLRGRARFQRDEFLQKFIERRSGQIRNVSQICNFISSLRKTASDPILISLVDAVSYTKVRGDFGSNEPNIQIFRGIFGRVDVSRVYVKIIVPAPWGLPGESRHSGDASFCLAPNAVSNPHSLYLSEQRGPPLSTMSDVCNPTRTLPPPLVPANIVSIRTGWELAPTVGWQVYYDQDLIHTSDDILQADSGNTYRCCFPPAAWQKSRFGGRWHAIAPYTIPSPSAVSSTLASTLKPSHSCFSPSGSRPPTNDYSSPLQSSLGLKRALADTTDNTKPPTPSIKRAKQTHTVTAFNKTPPVQATFDDPLPEALVAVKPWDAVRPNASVTAQVQDNSNSALLQPQRQVYLEPAAVIPSPTPQFVDTRPNVFGLFRRYWNGLPSHDPEGNITLRDLYNRRFHQPNLLVDWGRSAQIRTQSVDSSLGNAEDRPASPLLKPQFPPPNSAASSSDSSALTVNSKSRPQLGNRGVLDILSVYLRNGSANSATGLKELMAAVSRSELSLQEVQSTNWTQALQSLGASKPGALEDEEGWIDEEEDGWQKTKISIDVPLTGIVAIVKEHLSSSANHQHFHYQPFKTIWTPRVGMPGVRIFSEMYSANTFWEAHRKLQQSPREPNCDLERVIVGLMFFSDATQLTLFGNSKLWPCYMYFANDSKYRRGDTQSGAGHHVAYFDSLSPSFKDSIVNRTGGKTPSGGTLRAHCAREMFHAQWVVLLDDELKNAMKHGLVILCSDGVFRRFYIRIFTYSGDHPEKLLITTVGMGVECPCPKCLMSSSLFKNMGTAEDMAMRKTLARKDDAVRQQKVSTARHLIQVEKKALAGKAVKRSLGGQGHVPVENAFTKRLSDLNLAFDFHDLIVSDPLHEFELGVWKNLLTHLTRLLEAFGPEAIHTLDQRYREMPPFGRSIRKFHHNVSNMARRTGHDYEDALQCAIPAFDLLFPEPHNTVIMKLLFVCAQWHAYAKLRLHTEVTLKVFENLTMELGDQFRIFVSKTCAHIKAYELDREAKDRQRKNAKAKEQTSETVVLDNLTSSPVPTAAPLALGMLGWAPVNEVLTSQSNQGSSCSSTGLGESRQDRMREAPEALEFRFYHPPVNMSSQASSSRPIPTTGHPRLTVPSSQPSKGNSQEPSAENNSGHRETLASSTHEAFTVLEWQTPKTVSDYDQQSSSSHLGTGTAIPEQSTPMDARPMAPLPPPSEGSVCAPVPVHRAYRVGPQPSITKLKKLVKQMNLCTPKFHALGHCPEYIPLFGTTDSYTTEICEKGHKHPKGWFKSTTKRYIRFELSRQERKRARLKALRRQIELDHPSVATKAESDARKADIHHSIGGFSGEIILLPQIIYSKDPGCRDLVGKLKRHLLPRILARLCSRRTQDLPSLLEQSDWTRVSIPDQQLHPHGLARIKYTTYDVRRDEDMVHLVSDRFNIMIRNQDYRPNVPGLHPFRYAKVIGIYHADAAYIGPIDVLDGADYTAHRFDLFYVRWYEVIPAESPYHLDQARFLDIASEDAVGFLDPGDVLRMSHVTPRFSQGKVYSDGPGRSAFLGDKSDWKLYFINRFPDRDMHMRFQWGLAVGHKYTHQDALGIEQIPTYTGPNTRGATPFQTDEYVVEAAARHPTREHSRNVTGHDDVSAPANLPMDDSMDVDDDDDGSVQAEDDWSMDQDGFLGAMGEVDDEREREFELFATDF